MEQLVFFFFFWHLIMILIVGVFSPYRIDLRMRLGGVAKAFIVFIFLLSVLSSAASHAYPRTIVSGLRILSSLGFSKEY